MKPELHAIVRRRWTRRDVMKVAPLGAAAAGALGLGLIGAREGSVEERPGTCRFCLMHCGIIAHVKHERLLKVEGDLKSRTRGFVCEHGFALREMVHSQARLKRPLIRRGDAFHEVSWDEALAEVATRLQAVKAKYGPEAFLLQTGWPLVRHPLVNFLHRFMRAFGSPNVSTVASLCEASLRMGQALTVGTKYSADIRAARTLVMWGANPPTTAPPFAHVIAHKAEKGNLIVVDPLRTSLAKEATVHLRVRPGTDGALALGLMHLVLRDGHFDAEAMARDSVGLEALKALAARYPPDETERLTSVPVGLLEKTATLLATQGPIGIWQGLGVEHHENGVQTSRAITALEVLCGRFHGSLDLRSQLTPPGPNFANELLPALYRMRTPKPVPGPVKAQPLGRERFPLYEIYNREAQGQFLADAVLEDRPYPVRALMLVASNALVTSQGSQRLSQAVDKLDLLVTVDPFFSASARRSDVVLPATTFAEAPDVDDDDAVAKTGLVPPQHEALSDWTVVVRLARALGLQEFFPWDDFQDALKAPHVDWMLDESSQPHPEAQTDTPRFSTVTGKAEFASTLLARHGHEPLPVWTAPTEVPSAQFPLRLVTGPRPRAYINSQFHGIPSMEARLREPEALIHPDAAARFHVTSGRPVTVVSPYGRVTARAVVTEDVHPEAVLLPSGWAEANANLLISDRKNDPISGFPAFRSGVCRLE
jgi:anaerobic selenocysteine-containing dehydrogenase